MSRLRPTGDGRLSGSSTRRSRSPLVLLAVGLALLLPAVAAASAAASPCPFQISPTESPTTGTGAAPLLVSFGVSVSSGAPSEYSWAFGDGGYYNGSSPSFSQAEHEYSLPGTYNASVTVTESGCSVSASLPVHVTEAPLTATVTASSSSGTAPLTVTFHGTVSGGTETYRSLVWSFGDGGHGSGATVAYTFETAGHFKVYLNVTDSSGTVSSGTDWVNVTASPVTPPSNSPAPASNSWILPAVLAIVAILAILAFLVFWFTRAGPGSPKSAPISSAAAAPAAAPSAGAAPAGSVPGEPRAPDPAEVASPGRPPESNPPSEAAVTPSSKATPPSPEIISPETLRISQRVVLHMVRQGALRPDEVAPNGLTQAGMAEELSVGQNSLTNVLRRLETAGVVHSDVRHVRGRPRRLKVYTLTPRGESIAKELRSRRSPLPPPR
ncbi:MAG: PKD domain-containing protein [Thermoplasmata archaeon]|nr:PKD domain-containing protein [Thermoplasmata archaeon]